MVMSMKPKRGFTLIEMVVSILVLGILAGISGPLLRLTIDSMEFHSNRSEFQQSSAVALSRMSREIRRVQNDTSVVTANASQFEFVRTDGVTVRYRLVGTKLMRSLNGAADAELAEDVQALTFSYYDDDGNILGSPTAGLGTRTNIRRVEVKLDFQRDGESFSVQIQMTPRNLSHDADLFA